MLRDIRGEAVSREQYWRGGGVTEGIGVDCTCILSADGGGGVPVFCQLMFVQLLHTAPARNGRAHRHSSYYSAYTALLRTAAAHL